MGSQMEPPHPYDALIQFEAKEKGYEAGLKAGWRAYIDAMAKARQALKPRQSDSLGKKR